MRFFKLCFVLVVFFSFFAPDSAQAKTFDFSDWSVLLKKYVSPNMIDGVLLNTVDYGELRLDSVFPRLVNDLKLFSPSKLKTHEEKLAFWINVYNVFAVKVVIDNYPLKSIKDAGGFFKSVWKLKAGIVGGKEYTLAEIEHEILRKMGEPRIHTAIVCASISCPDLSIEVFKPGMLNEQLDIQMRNFLANPGKGMRVDARGGFKRIYLSPIFDWFEEDFESSGGVLKFIEPYVAPKYGQAFKNHALPVSYMDYNWSVNGS